MQSVCPYPVEQARACHLKHFEGQGHKVSTLGSLKTSWRLLWGLWWNAFNLFAVGLVSCCINTRLWRPVWLLVLRLEDTLLQCFHSSTCLAYFCWPVVCSPDVLRRSTLEKHTGVVWTLKKKEPISKSRGSPNYSNCFTNRYLLFKSECMGKSSLFGVCNWPNQQNSKIKIKVTGHSSEWCLAGCSALFSYCYDTAKRL